MFLKDPVKAAAGRIGAYATLSRTDPRQLTTAARNAFIASFETQVDPDGVLPLAERQRRAGYAQKAFMAKLAMKSARVRRERKGGGA